MASPRTIRTRLRDRIATIAGLTVYDRWPNSNGNLNLPCAILQPGEAEHEQVFGRGDLTKYAYEVHVFVSAAAGVEQGQDSLDAFLATSSTGGIFGAIAADRRLNNTVDGTFVKGYRDYSPIGDENQVVMMGAILDLEIWSS